MEEPNWDSIFFDSVSDDESRCVPANARIQQEIHDKAPNMLQIAPNFFITKENPSKVRLIAAIAISKCITFLNKADFKAISDFWVSDSFAENKDCIRTALFEGVMDASNPSLRNVCCQLFAQVIAIDPAFQQPGIQSLAESINNTDYRPIGTIAFLDIFRELVQLPNIPDLLRNYENLISQIFGSVVFILSTSIVDSDTLALVQSAVLTLKAAIPSVSELFGSESSQQFEHILEILNYLPPIFMHAPPTLFKALHDLMFSLLITFYSSLSEPDFEQLGQVLIEYSLHSLSMQDPIYLEAPLAFWTEVGEHEAFLMENAQDQVRVALISDPTRDPLRNRLCLGRGLVERFAEVAFPALFTLMTHVEEETLAEVEDPSCMTLPMYATQCLRALFPAAPLALFAAVTATWPAAIAEEAWGTRHAAIMAVWALLGDPCFVPDARQEFMRRRADLRREILIFIRDNVWEVLFQAAVQLDVPRVAESALFTLFSVIQRFPQLVRESLQTTMENCEKVFAVVRIGLENQVHDLTMLQRYAEIITAVATIFSPKEFHNPLSTLFDEASGLLDAVWDTVASSKFPHVEFETLSKLFWKIGEARNSIILHMGGEPQTCSVLSSAFESILARLRSQENAATAKTFNQNANENSDQNANENPAQNFNENLNENSSEKSNANINASYDFGKCSSENNMLYVLQRALLSNLGTILFAFNVSQFDQLSQELAEEALGLFLRAMGAKEAEAEYVWDESMGCVKQLITYMREHFGISEDNVMSILAIVKDGFESQNAQITEASLIVLEELIAPDKKNPQGQNPRMATDLCEIWQTIMFLLDENGPLISEAIPAALDTLGTILAAEVLSHRPKRSSVSQKANTGSNSESNSGFNSKINSKINSGFISEFIPGDQSPEDPQGAEFQARIEEHRERYRELLMAVQERLNVDLNDYAQVRDSAILAASIASGYLTLFELFQREYRSNIRAQKELMKEATGWIRQSNAIKSYSKQFGVSLCRLLNFLADIVHPSCNGILNKGFIHTQLAWIMLYADNSDNEEMYKRAKLTRKKLAHC